MDNLYKQGFLKGDMGFYHGGIGLYAMKSIAGVKGHVIVGLILQLSIDSRGIIEQTYVTWIFLYSLDATDPGMNHIKSRTLMREILNSRTDLAAFLTSGLKCLMQLQIFVVLSRVS